MKKNQKLIYFTDSLAKIKLKTQNIWNKSTVVSYHRGNKRQVLPMCLFVAPTRYHCTSRTLLHLLHLHFHQQFVQTHRSQTPSFTSPGCPQQQAQRRVAFGNLLECITKSILHSQRLIKMISETLHNRTTLCSCFLKTKYRKPQSSQPWQNIISVA